jgi:hypothetical protein
MADAAADMQALMARYKSASAVSDPRALAPAAVAAQVFLLDSLVGSLLSTRASLCAQLEADEALLRDKRSRAAALRAALAQLEGKQAEDAAWRARTGAAIQTAEQECAELSRLALCASRRAINKYSTDNARLNTGSLNASRGYSAAPSTSGAGSLRSTGSLLPPASPMRLVRR